MSTPVLAPVKVEPVDDLDSELDRSSELESLLQVIQTVTSAKDVPAMLREVTDAAMNLVQAMQGTILFWQPESNELHTVVSRVRGGGLAAEECPPLHDSANGLAFSTQQELLLSRSSPTGAESAYFLHEPGAQNAAIVPLTCGQRRIGTLMVVNKQTANRDFTARDLHLLRSLANLAAGALDRARLLDEVKASQGRYRSLVEGLPEMIYRAAINEYSTALYISPAVERITGYSVEEWLSRPDFWFLRLHPDDRQRVRQHLDSVLVSSDTFAREYRILHRDGHVVWIWDHGQIQRDASGRALYIDGVAEDITERKRAEQEQQDLNERLTQHAAKLEETNQALQEALAVKEEMVQNVSHELRTPLTHIRGYAELLQMRLLGDLTPEQEEAVSTIHQKGIWLSDLLEDLLLLRRLEQNMLRLETVDICEIVHSALSERRMQAENNGLTLTLQESGGSIDAIADRVRLSQVIGNLIDNAIKFTPRTGHITVRVAMHEEAHASHLRASSGERAIHITVADTGPGVPVDQLEKIFERFYQVEGPHNSRRGGMGIGLAIARQIVEAHGGRIWCESAPGQGATFHILLPTEPSMTHHESSLSDS